MSIQQEKRKNISAICFSDLSKEPETTFNLFFLLKKTVWLGCKRERERKKTGFYNIHSRWCWVRLLNNSRDFFPSYRSISVFVYRDNLNIPFQSIKTQAVLTLDRLDITYWIRNWDGIVRHWKNFFGNFGKSWNYFYFEIL